MFAELWCLCERFSAFLTEKWSFTCVGTDVIVQRGCACKCARAVTALKWFIVSVSDNMRAHFIWLGERLRAIVTRVWSSGHARADVNLEHVFLGEWLIALTAFHQAQLWAVRQTEPSIVITIFDHNPLFFQNDRRHIPGPLNLSESFPCRNGAVRGNGNRDLVVPRNTSVIRRGRWGFFFNVNVITWHGKRWFSRRSFGWSVWGDRWLTRNRRRIWRSVDWSVCRLCLTLGC